MRIVGSLLALMGTAAVGLGMALTVGGGPSADAITTTAVERLGNDYLLVATVGAAAFVLTLLVIAFRGVAGIDQLAPPDPEGIPSAPRMGADFDQFVNRRATPRVALGSAEDDRVRKRLRAAAVQAVMDRQGCPRETARQLVETGEWTVDPEAAAYLGGRQAPRPPWNARLLAVLRGRRWSQRGARRTAQTIVDVLEGRGA